MCVCAFASCIYSITHPYRNIEQILSAKGESALRVDDSTIEISAKDVVGTEKLKILMQNTHSDS